MSTIAELVRARVGDQHTGLRYEDESWTWDEVTAAAAARGAWLQRTLDPARPPHVGILLDNVPEFPFWLCATAAIGAVTVGINPTRRGAELVRDITHTDCQVIVTDASYLPMIEELGLDIPVVVTDGPGPRPWAEPASLPDVEVTEEQTYLLLFTSGTSGAPKACICTQGRLARLSPVVVEMFGITPDDVCYQAMPLFHSNALITSFAPGLAAGACTVLRRKFSASGFLPDVRRYGVTFFNYVGKPLSYILATAEQPDDADNTLWRVFGNEAADLDIARFGTRFGCTVTDGYGSTETGASISRVPEMPVGALGIGIGAVCVLDADTLEECPRAEFDDNGVLLNAEAATGEIVNKEGAAGFEGYYNNDEANAARIRNGWYWTGDLAYRDDAGFFYFAGRDFEWLRVDGENFSAAPVERIMARYPGVVLAAVYAVPDPVVGDAVMLALDVVGGPEGFDAAAFDAFLDAQADLGTKWSPVYIRVVASGTMPMTQTSKVLKKALRNERWTCPDPVWFRPAKGEPYRRLSTGDAAGVAGAFEARGRSNLLR